MFKRLFIVLVTTIAYFQCEDDGRDTNPVSIEKAWLRYEVGQTWKYRRMFINEGACSLLNVPDTIYGYSEFEVTKDTFFEKTTWLIVEGVDYDCNKDSVQKYISRYAISFNDTALKVYKFKNNNVGFSWGPFKRSFVEGDISKSDFFNIRNLSTKLLAKKMNSLEYNSTVFGDFFIPLVFNISPGYTWYYRGPGDPNENKPIEKVFIGQERITVPVGTYDSYKYELLSGKALGVPGITVFSWYTSNSLIKTWMDLGTTYINNIENKPSGIVHTWEIFEYLGTGKIDKKVMVPWGRNN